MQSRTQKYLERRGFSVWDPGLPALLGRRVAGIERPIDMIVHGEVTASGVVRATGTVPFRMTDFGIKPPTAFFGLLKARDDVTVRFDLRVRQDPKRVVAGN